MAGRYKAERVEFDGHKFDSKFECQIYKILRLYVPKCSILVHYPVCIANRTNRHFSTDWNHRVDFYIPSIDWYVEAKGHPTVEYKLILKALAATENPMLNRYCVVGQVGGTKLLKTLFTMDVKQFEVKAKNTLTPIIN